MAEQHSTQANRDQTIMTDIAIVGAGLAGSSMALALADSKYSITVLDAKPLAPATTPNDKHQPRVSALTPGTIRLLESLNAWQQIPASRVSPYSRMHVREADGTGEINFSAEDLRIESLGCIVENHCIQSALLARLSDYNNVTIEAPVTVNACETSQHTESPGNPPGSLLHLADGRRIHAKLVIAADGARSPVRDLVQIPVRSWDYNHTALVTTVYSEQPHQHTARQIFHDEGVLAFLPLSDAGPASQGQRACSIVWSLLPEQAEAMMALDEAAFLAALGHASEHWLGKIEGCEQRFSFPLRQCHAKRYFQDGVVLIGDAAHSIHPLAGQGANLGFQDVACLSRILKAGDRDLADPILLRRYQRERRPANLLMAGVMEGFKQLYADQPLPIRWLRNKGMQAVDHWPFIKNELVRQALS